MAPNFSKTVFKNMSKEPKTYVNPGKVSRKQIRNAKKFIKAFGAEPDNIIKGDNDGKLTLEYLNGDNGSLFVSVNKHGCVIENLDVNNGVSMTYNTFGGRLWDL